MWEYKVVGEGLFYNPDLEGWLNSFGKDGWELIQIDTRDLRQYDAKDRVFIFKRRVDWYKQTSVDDLAKALMRAPIN